MLYDFMCVMNFGPRCLLITKQNEPTLSCSDFLFLPSLSDPRWGVYCVERTLLGENTVHDVMAHKRKKWAEKLVVSGGSESLFLMPWAMILNFGVVNSESTHVIRINKNQHIHYFRLAYKTFSLLLNDLIKEILMHFALLMFPISQDHIA